MDINTISNEVEKVSKLYAGKFGINRDANWFILKLQEELGELIQSYLMMVGQAKTKGKTQEEMEQSFKEEMADVLSHVLLLAKYHNIDLEAEVNRKWLSWIKT